MRVSLLLPLFMLVCSSAAQAAPYDPYPWCAAYGGSWSGASNCGFKTLQQCMATVSGIGGSCEPNQFYNPGRSGRRAKTARSRPITVRTMPLAIGAFPARPISSTINNRRRNLLFLAKFFEKSCDGASSKLWLVMGAPSEPTCLS